MAKISETPATAPAVNCKWIGKDTGAIERGFEVGASNYFNIYKKTNLIATNYYEYLLLSVTAIVILVQMVTTGSWLYCKRYE